MLSRTGVEAIQCTELPRTQHALLPIRFNCRSADVDEKPYGEHEIQSRVKVVRSSGANAAG